jgi:hypothetical protein
LVTDRIIPLLCLETTRSKSDDTLSLFVQFLFLVIVLRHEVDHINPQLSLSFS